MIPYYKHAGITIYHGDAREILPQLDTLGGTVCITDPVWPNAHPDLVGADRPLELFREVMAACPPVETLCVWLGCQSDPRFLEAVPASYAFLRTCYMRYSVPSYNGRCLVTGDFVYCYGSWPSSRPGRRVIPEGTSGTSKPAQRVNHPCPRKLEHAAWVVNWWTDPESLVLDPYAGAGTILRAAKDKGRKAIGIEIEERYCEIAARRMSQEVLAL